MSQSSVQTIKFYLNDYWFFFFMFVSWKVFTSFSLLIKQLETKHAWCLLITYEQKHTNTLMLQCEGITALHQRTAPAPGLISHLHLCSCHLLLIRLSLFSLSFVFPCFVFEPPSFPPLVFQPGFVRREICGGTKIPRLWKHGDFSAPWQ